MGDNNQYFDLQYFAELCKAHPEMVQKMADKSQILNHDYIHVCMEHGIEFNPQFLEKVNFKPPEIDEELNDVNQI